MEYELEISYNCGTERAVRHFPTFTAAFEIAQMFDGNSNVDIYITPSDGKFLYEKLANDETLVAERDRADFDEIVSLAKTHNKKLSIFNPKKVQKQVQDPKNYKLQTHNKLTGTSSNTFFGTFTNALQMGHFLFDNAPNIEWRIFSADDNTILCEKLANGETLIAHRDRVEFDEIISLAKNNNKELHIH